ncbi:hypothetical protein EVG20_g5076 [Dentipellis fragilis]|uniref:CP-type G domain-containing protein n=1 Tax=Dentipellis fragilis TaxID=205917 RepID=A0A4Y9YUD4_9AGAM|nr:hypothetical protein EVG20_g5076 [Dentipellis fragilis]
MAPAPGCQKFSPIRQHHFLSVPRDPTPVPSISQPRGEARVHPTKDKNEHSKCPGSGRTSKRGTTHQRSKIKQKAAESRKKSKREAKRNPEWKSKKPKDPGIPNNFPYKEQILAEVAEERRQAAEAKARRKEENKALRAKQRKAEAGEESDEASEAEGDDEADAIRDAFDGIKSLTAGTTSAKKENGKAVAVVEEEEDTAPGLINPDLPTLKSVLDVADVVVEILDARDPLPYRSAVLEKAALEKKGRRLLLVLNKIDTSPRESVAAWAGELRSSHPTIIFRSASSFLPSSTDASSKGKQKAPANDAWGIDSVTALLSKWADEKAGSDPLTVAVVGLTNSGKSSFVNSLLRKATFPIYNLASSSPNQGPTTTAHAQETTLDLNGKQIRLIDTPGIAWQRDDDDRQAPEDIERSRARDILLRSKGKLDRLKDPEPAVTHIVERAEQQDLMVFYNIPAFAKGDTGAFLSGVARANGYIKKGGVLDLLSAARVVLRDWSTGKFPRYTVPTSATGTAPTPAPEDEAVLARLATRKELRKAVGLVKMVPEAVDERAVELEAPWFGGEESEDEEDASDNDDEEEEGDDVEMDAHSGEEDEDEDEEEHDEDEEDEEPEPVVVKGKRKRTSQPVAPAPKKVAFSGIKSHPAPSPASSKTVLKSALKPSKEKAEPKAKKPAPVKEKAPAKAKVAAPAAKKAANAPVEEGGGGGGWWEG